MKLALFLMTMMLLPLTLVMGGLRGVHRELRFLSALTEAEAVAEAAIKIYDEDIESLEENRERMKMML